MTALNDFEFRVWDTYRWAADDFGVMPKSASKLRGENDALRAQHTDEEVASALQRLITLELITEFDHQGAQYVCSLTWQTHQKIEYPRQTHLPAPSREVIDLMGIETRRLFLKKHHDFQKSPSSRARQARETANGKRQTADGSGEGSGKGAGLQRMSSSRGLQRSGDLTARFERFWAVYPRKTAKDAARKEFLKIAPDDALTDTMIATVRQLRASEQWLKDDGKFIPHGRTWLHGRRWEDEREVNTRRPRGGYVPQQRIPWACPHVDECSAGSICANAMLLKRPEIEGAVYELDEHGWPRSWEPIRRPEAAHP